jgi:hypothetical protein
MDASDLMAGIHEALTNQHFIVPVRQLHNPAWPDCDHDSDSDSVSQIDGSLADQAGWPAGTARIRMTGISAGRIRHRYRDRYRFRFRNPSRFRILKNGRRARGRQECLRHHSGYSRALPVSGVCRRVVRHRVGVSPRSATASRARSRCEATPDNVWVKATETDMGRSQGRVRSKAIGHRQGRPLRNPVV